jgi:hypothetical protein
MLLSKKFPKATRKQPPSITLISKLKAEVKRTSGYYGSRFRELMKL